MGKARRFYGNPFCFLAHMTGRLSPERGRISNQNNKSSAGTPVCCAGTRNWRLPQSLRAHTQPLDCQAADSTAAILWRKKTRGGSTDCRVSFETGANKSGIQCVYASFSNLCTPRRKRREEGNSGICSALFQLRFALFFLRRDHQHRAAPTWPDGTECAQIETHTGLHIFLMRKNQLQ